MLLRRLLGYGAAFRHLVVHSSLNSLAATVSKDKYDSGACFIQGQCSLNLTLNLSLHLSLTLWLWGWVSPTSALHDVSTVWIIQLYNCTSATWSGTCGLIELFILKWSGPSTEFDMDHPDPHIGQSGPLHVCNSLQHYNYTLHDISVQYIVQWLIVACSGGSLLLAHNGICLIPDLNAVKKTTRQMLLQGNGIWQ